jgi:hypothetical protein
MGAGINRGAAERFLQRVAGVFSGEEERMSFNSTPCESVMPRTNPPGRFVCHMEFGHKGPHRSPLPDGGAAMWTEDVLRPSEAQDAPAVQSDNS